jgi:hypothetical protein
LQLEPLALPELLEPRQTRTRHPALSRPWQQARLVLGSCQSRIHLLGLSHPLQQLERRVSTQM